jgi:hypothetical protein
LFFIEANNIVIEVIDYFLLPLNLLIIVANNDVFLPQINNNLIIIGQQGFQVVFVEGVELSNDVQFAFQQLVFLFVFAYFVIYLRLLLHLLLQLRLIFIIYFIIIIIIKYIIIIINIIIIIIGFDIVYLFEFVVFQK